MFLTRAALIDPRMKRVDPVEQRDMAKAWADVLPDVTLDDALAALAEHYRWTKETIAPSDVLALSDVELESPFPSIDAELEADARRRALDAAGVTEEEYAAHENDIPWLRAHFVTKELGAGDE